MASLKFIMIDADEEVDPRANKKDKDSGTRPPPQHHGSSSLTTNSSYATEADQPETLTSPSPPGKRRSSNKSANKSSSSSSSTAVAGSSSTSSNRPTNPGRRRSNASNDSMDQSGYGLGGHAGSSSSGPSNQPMRPFASMQGGGDLPVKLTPITGRVSRAKKGIPVHTCDTCKPPKTFTRAEHLRRHQLSHQTPAYNCTVPGCERAFHRKDLLDRHQQRHEQEGEEKKGSDESRRMSSVSQSSLEHKTGRLDLQHASAMGGLAGSSVGTPSSLNEGPMTPGNLGGGASFHQASPGGSNSKSRSPQMGGGGSYRPTSSGHYGGGGDAGYTLSSHSPPHISLSAVSTVVSSHFGTGLDYAAAAPRTQPQLPLYPLEIPSDAPPDLNPHDGSAWPSSASDSTYSTPSDNSRHRSFWPPMQQRSPSIDYNHHLSPYTVNAYSPGGGLELGGLTSSTLGFGTPFTTSPVAATLAAAHHFGTTLDVPNPAGFADEQQALLDAHGHHTHHIHHHHTAPQTYLPLSNTVRSPGSPTSSPSSTSNAVMTTSAQTSENALVTTAVIAASSPDHHRIMNPMALGRIKEAGLISAGLLAAPALMAAPSPPLSRAVRAAIPQYLDTYWSRFHPMLPAVHRPTFEALVGSPAARSGGSGGLHCSDPLLQQTDVLRCAMAAIGTQFIDNKEDRIRGNSLHEYAITQVGFFHQWTVPIMQAILLCEWFSRFRGRRAIIRPSNEFRSVYERVREDSAIWMQIPTLGSNEERWQSWLEMEAKRRMLAACFIIDIHSSIYHEHAFTHHYNVATEGVPPIPLTQATEDLWSATNASGWAALASMHQTLTTGLPTLYLHELDHDNITADEIHAFPPFDQGLILVLEALRLKPRANVTKLELSTQVPPTDQSASRMVVLFPDDPVMNTYLALHHTPLHDLLAVSGDSWVFSQKVVGQTSFLEHKKRLKQWSNSGTAAAATVFAARALKTWFRNGYGRASRSEDGENDVIMCEGTSRHFKDHICDYWAMYSCALICWAFAHQHTRATATSSPTSSTSSSSATTAKDEEAAAVAWVRVVSELQPREAAELLRSMKGAACVVGLVRKWLERDCLGSKSRLFVDAVGVLKKLEEGVNWKWF